MTLWFGNSFRVRRKGQKIVDLMFICWTLNKLLNKQSSCFWFETPWRSCDHIDATWTSWRLKLIATRPTACWSWQQRTHQALHCWTWVKTIQLWLVDSLHKTQEMQRYHTTVASFLAVFDIYWGQNNCEFTDHFKCIFMNEICFFYFKNHWTSAIEESILFQIRHGEFYPIRLDPDAWQTPCTMHWRDKPSLW